MFLCRFKSETSNLVGTVEVTYVSLKTIYSIMDSYQFSLVYSSVSLVLDMRQPEDWSAGQDSRGPGLASSHGVPSGAALQI